MREVTGRDLFHYIIDTENAFHECVMNLIDDITKDGSQLTHTKLKRLKKKAAIQFIKFTQREEKINEQLANQSRICRSPNTQHPRPIDGASLRE